MSGHNILQQLAREPEMEIVSIVTAASETRKIASPERAGVILALCFKTDGGDVAITGSGSEILNSGVGTQTTATMADAGDLLVLMSIEKGTDIIWSPVANNGAAMS